MKNKLVITIMMSFLVLTGCVQSNLDPSVDIEIDDTTEVSRPSSILYRRTTLHGDYARVEIEQNIMEEIINAGFTAPTGGNQRSIEFFPITDSDLLQSISNVPGYFSGVRSAPFAVVIASNRTLSTYPELEEMDSGLAAMAMIVAATDYDLSTCVMSIAPQTERIESFKQILNLTDSYHPILLVTFGYAKEDAITSSSVTNYTKNKVHWNGLQDE